MQKLNETKMRSTKRFENKKMKFDPFWWFCGERTFPESDGRREIEITLIVVFLSLQNV